ASQRKASFPLPASGRVWLSFVFDRPAPALDIALTAAPHRQLAVGHIIGNNRSGTHCCLVADFYRRYQRRVGTDKGTVTNFGLELVYPVVIAGNGARAYVGFFAH